MATSREPAAAHGSCFAPAVGDLADLASRRDCRLHFVSEHVVIAFIMRGTLLVEVVSLGTLVTVHGDSSRWPAALVLAGQVTEQALQASVTQYSM